MKELSTNQMESLVGGQAVTREQYCDGLWDILTGGGYQGDILWGWEVYDTNCVDD